MLDRAYGCLVGGAIGDALGAPVEGASRQDIQVSDFVSDAPIGTDDTDYAIFNALLILEHGRDLTSSQVEDSWRRLLLAPGAHFRRGGFSDVYAARNLVWGLHPPQSGSFNPQSWSDGVAMAIGAAPVVSPAACTSNTSGCAGPARSSSVVRSASAGVAGRAPCRPIMNDSTIATTIVNPASTAAV